VKRIRLITLEDLLEMKVNHDAFKLVEVLSSEQYREGHIPGAINLPEAEIPKKHDDVLKKGDTIVVYCNSYRCQASTRAAGALLELGYKNTLDFKASKKGWVDAGLELEK